MLQKSALVQDDIEKALEKEMDKMQSTTEAGWAFSSVVGSRIVVLCKIYFWFVCVIFFPPVVSDLKSACCKRLHLCRTISKRPWKKRWTRCSRRQRQGGHSVLLLDLELLYFASCSFVVCCVISFSSFFLILNLRVAKVCTCAGRYRKGLGKRDGQDAVDDRGRVGIQFCCWV